MISFVALPAFLILLTLVSVALRIFPVSKRVPVTDEGRAGDTPASIDAARSARTGVRARSQVLDSAKRAAGPEYREEAAPQMYVEDDTCACCCGASRRRPVAIEP
jgi:hypothetical protein